MINIISAIGFASVLIAVIAFGLTWLQNRVVYRLMEDQKVPNDMARLHDIRVRFRRFRRVESGGFLDSVGVVYLVKYMEDEFTLFVTFGGSVSYL